MAKFTTVSDYYSNDASFSDLVGKTPTEVHGLEAGSYAALFVTAEGPGYLMHHRQDCCESVSIYELDGDPNDLVGEPILFADEIDSEDRGPACEYEESYTWTFYRIGTIKGTVVIRWYGSSNGYYSEGVDFVKVKDYTIG